MPRKARVDVSGALHHIICRGIERQRIFRDNKDRDNFVERLGNILARTSTHCYAWSLIPNHFHILLKTGHAPITTDRMDRSARKLALQRAILSPAVE